MFSLCKKISSVLVNPFFLNMQRGLKLCKITEMFLFFFLNFDLYIQKRYAECIL
jgi:hypothetical protein